MNTRNTAMNTTMDTDNDDDDDEDNFMNWTWRRLNDYENYGEMIDMKKVKARLKARTIHGLEMDVEEMKYDLKIQKKTIKEENKRSFTI